MTNDFGDSSALLGRLLRQIISEKDPDECDQLGVEIWRLLHKIDRRRKPEAIQKRTKDGQNKRAGSALFREIQIIQ